MLHPEAGENFNRTVIHADRNVNDDLARRIAEYFPKAFVQVEFLRREVESSSLGFPGIDFLLEGECLHTDDLQWFCERGPLCVAVNTSIG